MDGMGDMDAPMPPMGADGMDDPMGGEDPMGDDPNAMGGNDPMGGDPSAADGGMGDDPMGDDPMGGEDPMGDDPNAMGDENDEFMNKFNSLPKDKQVAAEKYVDSMVDDNEPMPMESRRSIKRIIDEVINDIWDDKEGTKRPSKDLPRAYRNMKSPFTSPW